ncbi:MAG: hypothetical protein E6I31_04895 [Chloroflexi bacterium]|nr:MAG: hypothetical protein E6I31_04895 [Chloroflexota bacterium]
MRRGLLAFAGAALLLGTAYAGSAGQSVSASATAPLPIVATVQPSTGPLSGGQSVIVSGQNFQTGATVGFGTWATMTASTRWTALVVCIPMAGRPLSAEARSGPAGKSRAPPSSRPTTAAAWCSTATAVSTHLGL